MIFNFVIKEVLKLQLRGLILNLIYGLINMIK